MADKRISQLVDRGTIENNDVVPIVVSGATTTNKATISSIQTFMQENLDVGVTSVGITLGSSGTDVNVTGSPITTSGNITINIPTASATNRGLLSATDWTTFNSKQPAGNYVTLDTAQTITGEKTFDQDIYVNSRRIGRGAGNVSSNTVIGNSALRDNTTGSENTAIGGGALREITTGSANTAVGFQAMLNSETGAGNVAIGNSTLAGINGSNNVAVGNSAGRYIAGGTTLNQTSTNSVYLGSSTRPSADGNTNEIVIGYNAIGQGSNTVTIGNSSTTSNKLFGRVIHADAVNADESATLGQVNTTLGNYVTLDTAQTITAQKVFNTSGSSDSVIITHGSGSGIALDVIKAGNNEALKVTKTSGSGNAVTITGGDLSAEAASFSGNIAANGGLTLAAAGTANPTILRNTSGTSSSTTGSNVIGFNGTNNIFVTTQNQGGFILGFDNSVSNREYTLPDASGTIALTSNLSAYLPLTGGTLTGALNGTTASFSDLVNITASPGGAAINLRGRTADDLSQILFFSNNGSGLQNYIQSTPSLLSINSQGNTPIEFRTNLAGGGGTRMTISGAGAVTLTGALNGTSASFTGDLTASSNAFFGTFNGNDKYHFEPFTNAAGGANNAYLVSGKIDNNERSGFVFQARNSNGDEYNALIVEGYNSTSTTPALTLASTGAATFSSSVTATANASGRSGLFGGSSFGLRIDNAGSFNNGGTTLHGVDNTFVASYQKLSLNGSSLEFMTDYSPRVTITNSGNVGIGTASPTRRLQVEASPSGGIEVGRFVNNSNSEINDFVLVSILGSNGNSTSSFHYIAATGAADKLYIFGNGNVVNTNNSYGALSDIKVKENIEDATPKLDDLMRVKVRNYNLIGDDKKQIGVIAQELEEVFPAMIDESEDFEEVEVPQLDEEGNEILNEEGEVVTEKQRVSKGTTTKSVKYSVFVPMLIKAMQEQQEQMKVLTEQIDSLKNQIK
jgi:hypothetical protein